MKSKALHAAVYTSLAVAYFEVHHVICALYGILAVSEFFGMLSKK